MPRLPRLKIDDDNAWYHLCARVAGKRGDYTIDDDLCRNKLEGLIKHFTSIYFCDVAAFCLMGNHYHLLLRFHARRELSREELELKAKKLYPNNEKLLKAWSEKDWKRLEARLFDLSELMRNVQGAFATWFNLTHDRTGRFWGERFKSTLLEEGQAVLDCLLYIELNPVRAGIVKRPENYAASSCALRHAKADRWLIPLTELFDHRERKRALVEYRALLYHRGNIPSKEGQARIPDDILEAEIARGYEISGVFSRRLRSFTDGLALGSESFVRQMIGRLRARGRALRRKHPKVLETGTMTSLRQQRSRSVPRPTR